MLTQSHWIGLLKKTAKALSFLLSFSTPAKHQKDEINQIPSRGYSFLCFRMIIYWKMQSVFDAESSRHQAIKVNVDTNFIFYTVLELWNGKGFLNPFWGIFCGTARQIICIKQQELVEPYLSIKDRSGYI